jgi:hypothetical protein
VKFCGHSEDNLTYSRVEAFLRRSGVCLLDVRMQITQEYRYLQTLIQVCIDNVISLLVLHSGRWRSLMVCFWDINLGKAILGHLSKTSLMQLQYLHLCNRDDTTSTTIRPPGFALDAQHLTSLRINGLSLQQCSVPLENITDLRLYRRNQSHVVTYEFFRDSLLSAPRLSSLVLVGILLTFSSRTTLPRIRLPFITHLTTSFVAGVDAHEQHYASIVLELLETPNVEHLVLDNIQEPLDFGRFIDRMLTHNLSERYASLRTLQLNEIKHWLDSDLWKAFPTIEHLLLGDTQVDLLFQSVIDESLKAHTPQDVPWPRLRALSMIYPDVDTLRELVKSRQACSAPLEYLEVNLPGGSNFQEFASPAQRHDISRLRQMVDVRPLPSCLRNPRKILHAHLTWGPDEPGEIHLDSDSNSDHDSEDYPYLDDDTWAEQWGSPLDEYEDEYEEEDYEVEEFMG